MKIFGFSDSSTIKNANDDNLGAGNEHDPFLRGYALTRPVWHHLPCYFKGTGGFFLTASRHLTVKES